MMPNSVQTMATGLRGVLASSAFAGHSRRGEAGSAEGAYRAVFRRRSAARNCFAWQRVRFRNHAGWVPLLCGLRGAAGWGVARGSCQTTAPGADAVT